jgi:SAM-dependent methyltransferase
VKKITSETVRADFNDPVAVVHYTRAAHFLGLWKSEQLLIQRFFPDKAAHLLEAGCGSGRVTLGLWHDGYHHLTAFDFAEELVDQARHLALERGASPIRFLHADATRLSEVCHVIRDKSEVGAVIPAASAERRDGEVCHVLRDKLLVPEGGFHGALFMFNGLMQIPGRDLRRKALKELRSTCRKGAKILFTTHDRNGSEMEKALWRLEAQRWKDGKQDSRLVDFGDRYFEDENGRTFMHLPDRAEILEDLATTGWRHVFDAMRNEVAKESRAVLDFSDECRFWCAENPE